MWHNIMLLLRDSSPLISYLVMPMVLMLVLRPLYVQALDQGVSQIVIGPLVMFSVLSLHLIGNSLVMEREWRTWDRLQATRASIAELMIAKAVPAMLVLFVQQTVLFCFGCLVIGLPAPSSPGLLAVAMMLWSFSLVAMGFALASVVRSHGQMGAVADIGALLLSALGGALLPVALMPEWAQGAALASPGYWAISLLRGAVDGDVSTTLLPGTILLAVGLFFGVFAILRISRNRGRGGMR